METIHNLKSFTFTRFHFDSSTVSLSQLSTSTLLADGKAQGASSRFQSIKDGGRFESILAPL